MVVQHGEVPGGFSFPNKELCYYYEEKESVVLSESTTFSLDKVMNFLNLDYYIYIIHHVVYIT